MNTEGMTSRELARKVSKVTLAALYRVTAENNGILSHSGCAFFVALPHISKSRFYLGDKKKHALKNLNNIIARYKKNEKWFSDVMGDPELLAMIEDAVIKELTRHRYYTEYLYALTNFAELRRVEFLNRMESEGKISSFTDEYGKYWGIKIV